MSRLYRIQEFAELGGVTVKALHHYDRLGLLKPRRSDSGYRIYAEKDLVRLRQITALKFLGLPLNQIQALLNQTSHGLPDTLKMQRLALEKQRLLLSRAIRAIQAAEAALQTGETGHPKVLKTIIRVIDMQTDIDAMKKYYNTEEAWEKRRRFYEEGPSPEWQELYNDISAALAEDPAGEIAQSLADRWLNLSLKAYDGDPEQQVDSISAWMDRDNWPPAMKDRVKKFNLEKVNEFLRQAAFRCRKKYFSDEAWTKLAESMGQSAEEISIRWQNRVDLFRDIESSLGEDPAGPKGLALAERWITQQEAASGGDPGIKSGLLKLWADRKNWTASLRWREESVCSMSSERFERAADFLDRALRHRYFTFQAISIISGE